MTRRQYNSGASWNKVVGPANHQQANHTTLSLLSCLFVAYITIEKGQQNSGIVTKQKIGEVIRIDHSLAQKFPEYQENSSETQEQKTRYKNRGNGLMRCPFWCNKNRTSGVRLCDHTPSRKNSPRKAKTKSEAIECAEFSVCGNGTGVCLRKNIS